MTARGANGRVRPERRALRGPSARRQHGADGQHQPDHALQPGARLQQVLRQEGEGEAQ